MNRFLRSVLMHRLLLGAALAASTAAAASLSSTDLFTAGSHGYAIYRIPGIVVTAKGALLAYAEARRHASGDWGAIDIVLRRSQDGGRSWSPQRVIAEVPGPVAKNPAAVAQKLGLVDGVTYNNPVAIAARDGTVHFLFCVEYMRAFYMRSRDDGRTFSPPVEITRAFEAFRRTYDWKVLATGPGHGIELRNGRLLVPVWISLGTGGHAHRPSVVATIFSDDGGNTWQGGEIAVPDTPEVVNPSETAAVELAGGRVMLNARSESPRHRRVVVFSPDGATRWSAPRFQEELVEPICFASLVRYGDTRRPPYRILFVNPDNLKRGGEEGQPGRNRDRKNLTVQLSEDDGATWKVKRVIEPGWAGYADIAAGPDGAIYCLFERGAAGADHFRPVALTLVKFPLSWLTAASK